jgi:adenosylcobinamide-GDP ribazoletransferase
MNAFFIALQFLTRLPIKQDVDYNPEQMGQSLLWYPLIGFLIGLFLLLVYSICHALGFSPLVIAAILLINSIILTGALHWDGLADCADAWLAGSDREKTLAILKDTHCGAAAVVFVGALLLLQLVVFDQAIEHHHIMAILVAPMLSRSSAIALMMQTPYVREGGLGDVIARYFSRSLAQIILIGVATITLASLGARAFIVMAGLFIVYAPLRYVMLKRLGGITGDTIGALIVISETVVILLAGY